MTFHIITIFPDIFTSYFNESMLKRAQKKKIIDIKIHNLRDWTTDKHKTVDDTPYGGGAGMVMKVEPIYKALQHITRNLKHITKTSLINLSRAPMREGDRGIKTAPIAKGGVGGLKTILLSAKGKKWNQQLAKKYSRLDNIILICGRYEGVDERIKKFIDEEISIGDYILTGGEIGAMAIADSITRLLPGVLGNALSAKYESHATPGTLEYPQYTRPEIFHITHNMKHVTKSPLVKGGRGVKIKSKIENRKSKIEILRVPKILLSGNHKKIEEWRRKKMKKIK